VLRLNLQSTDLVLKEERQSPGLGMHGDPETTPVQQASINSWTVKKT